MEYILNYKIISQCKVNKNEMVLHFEGIHNIVSELVFKERNVVTIPIFLYQKITKFDYIIILK